MRRSNLVFATMGVPNLPIGTMVNKFVYDAETSSVSSASGVRVAPGPSLWLRVGRATLIAAAIGASIVGMGMAAEADRASSQPAEPRP